LANAKVNFGITEHIVFFALPVIIAILATAKLALCRLTFLYDRIILERFALSTLRHQIFSIALADVVFGMLSNNARDQAKIKLRSSLAVVPISVLYLEYRNGERIAKIAFDVSSLDNRALRLTCSQYPSIHIAGYAEIPRL
jgi:hypothetical protein